MTVRNDGPAGRGAILSTAAEPVRRSRATPPPENRLCSKACRSTPKRHSGLTVVNRGGRFRITSGPSPPKGASKTMSKGNRTKQKRGHSGAPSKIPFMGAQVIFMYGNPHAIASPTVPMSAIVTSMGSLDGRIVHGRAFTDPGVSGTTPEGKPIEVPPVIPMIGAKYSTSGAKLTWHWRGEVKLSSLNLLRGDTAPEAAAPVDDGVANDTVEEVDDDAAAVDAPANDDPGGAPNVVRLK